MSKRDAVEEFILTFFLSEEDQQGLDPNDLSNYHPEEVQQIFVPDR